MRKNEALWVAARLAGVAVVVAARVAFAAPETKAVEEKYPSGVVQARYVVGADGVKNGLYQTFFENGKLKDLGNYSHGNLEGPFQTNFEKGQVALKCSYKKGALDGVWIAFDEKGNKTKSGEYLAGKKNGFFREFAAGKVTSEQFFVDDVLVLPRSVGMIEAKLAEIRKSKVTTVEAKNAVPAHRGGKQSEEDREAGARMLDEYRYLCNVPGDIALDAVYNAHDEAAAALLSELKKLDHHPPNVGWPEADYEFGKLGCGSSNLYMGAANPAEAVRGFMNDSDATNIDRIGHRRWCINPTMAKTGFGQTGKFIAMWSFDQSGKGPEYEYVAYPAAGLFPNTHFDAGAAWSISLNLEKYLAPDEKKVKVSVKPAQIAASPAGIRTGPEVKLSYFHVDNQGFGIADAIIFRFDGCSTKTGAAYVVEVTGLETAGGEAAAVKYVVEFYSSGR